MEAPQDGGVLNAATLLEMSGESCASEVREAVVRGMGFASVCPVSLCSDDGDDDGDELGGGQRPWSKLEALSLSQNPVGRDAQHLWQWLGRCSALRTLNLNFCEVATLEGAGALRALEQLYLSTNRVSDISPLARCAELKTLIMHRNAVAESGGCLSALGQLRQLAELDLSGNPIWFDPKFKHEVVCRVASLSRYDDELVTDLDRELAVESCNGGASSPSRPSTAPAARRHIDSSELSSSMMMLPIHSSAAAAVLRSRRSAGGAPTPTPGRAAASPASAEDERRAAVDTINLGSTGGSFVQRLRKSTAVLGDPVTPIPCAAAVPSLDKCLEDPVRGVHALYAIVQELTAKLTAHPAPPVDTAARHTSEPTFARRALERENAQLKLENSNMYFLKSQNDELTRRVEELTRPGTEATAVGDAAAMREELQALRHNYRELLQRSNAADAMQRPATAAEVIASCEENYDADLAELFRRNERGLREIRQDLDAAKQEFGEACA